jgi:hypothetical protein
MRLTASRASITSSSGAVLDAIQREDPTLDLNFEETKTLTDDVSGTNLITFSRASSGTYVDSDGLIKTAVTDAPRFDHDPVTGESLGLLIEESRTNLLAYSEQFDDSYWEKYSLPGTGSAPSVTANHAVAPDGTNTATRLQCDLNGGTTSSDRSFIRKLGISDPGGATRSIYVRSNTGANQSIYFANNQNNNPTYTVTTEWTRLSDYQITSNTAFRIGCRGSLSQDSIDILIWGAQLEEGSFSTSYIPTSGSTVTRSPDLATIEGTNFTGGWYNQSEGTIFTDISPLAAASGRGYLFSNGSNDQRLGQNTDNATIYALFMSSNGSVTSLSAAASGMPKPIKACLAYKPGSSRGVIDGALKILSTTNNVPDAINQVGIGFQNYLGSSEFLNGHIARLAYFPVRKTDEELVNMTL